MKKVVFSKYLSGKLNNITFCLDNSLGSFIVLLPIPIILPELIKSSLLTTKASFIALI